MLSLVSLVAFVIGLVILRYGKKDEDVVRELGRALVWCGLLVLLLELASWHAVPLH